MNKQLIFISAIIIVFFTILALLYFQLIILEAKLILVIAILFIIVAVILVVWWFLSRRKGRPLRLGKDLPIYDSDQNKPDSEKLAKLFWANKGVLLKFPKTHFCWGETKFDEDGTNKFHGLGGIGYTRVKKVGNVMEPIDPNNTKEIGRYVTVVNATEKEVVNWYSRPYKDTYEDVWKRLGIISSSRKPTQVTKIREVSPITGTEKETLTAPIGSQEVQPKEEVV